MPSPETATMTASCVISYIGIGEVWQVPMESRPWRRLSSVPRTQVSRSLLHGPLKLNLWAHLHLPLASSKCLILCLTFHCGRAESIRTGLALPFSSRTVGLPKFTSSAPWRTRQKHKMWDLFYGHQLDQPSNGAYPSTTHKEKLSRDGGGTGAPAKLCELTLSSQACISCRDTKSSCGRKRERITAVLICLP